MPIRFRCLRWDICFASARAGGPGATPVRWRPTSRSIKTLIGSSIPEFARASLIALAPISPIEILVQILTPLKPQEE